MPSRMPNDSATLVAATPTADPRSFPRQQTVIHPHVRSSSSVHDTDIISTSLPALANQLHLTHPGRRPPSVRSPCHPRTLIVDLSSDMTSSKLQTTSVGLRSDACIIDDSADRRPFSIHTTKPTEVRVVPHTASDSIDLSTLCVLFDDKDVSSRIPRDLVINATSLATSFHTRFAVELTTSQNHLRRIRISYSPSRPEHVVIDLAAIDRPRLLLPFQLTRTRMIVRPSRVLPDESCVVAVDGLRRGDLVSILTDLPTLTYNTYQAITRSRTAFFDTRGFPESCINHSCQPNLALDFDDWSFRAVHDVPPDTELTFDYLTSEDVLARPFVCQCQSPRCRGPILGYRFLSIDDQAALVSHASPYLREVHAETVARSSSQTHPNSRARAP